MLLLWMVAGIQIPATASVRAYAAISFSLISNASMTVL